MTTESLHTQMSDEELIATASTWAETALSDWMTKADIEDVRALDAEIKRRGLKNVVTADLTIAPWSHNRSTLMCATGFNDFFPSCPNSAPEARAHVARLLDAQPIGLVKLYHSMSDTAYTAIWQEIKGRGFKVKAQGKDWIQYERPAQA